MSKYIDADELKKSFIYQEDAEYSRWSLSGILDEIDDIEAADVQEVVKEWCNERNCIIVAREDFPRLEVQHGKWLYLHLDPDDITGHTKGECSICGKLRIVDNYCPNCGARMDGEEE